MEPKTIFTICFGTGAILLMIAISYVYAIKSSPKNKKVAYIFWILGDVILVLSLFLQYNVGKDVIPIGVMIVISNFAIWNTMKKEKENIKRDNWDKF
jgi:nicotinamide riboside transporter PnuC